MNTTTIDAEVVTTTETKQPLILKGSGYGLEIAPSYQAQKTELLKHAALIVTITDTAADSAADIQIKKLAAMRIETEKARVKVKEPALDFGKTVDATAKDFIADITAEEDRLKKARREYAAAVLAERNRIIRELEEKRLAEEKARREADAKEAARIEAERVAAEAAEKARIEAEEAAFNATTPEDDAEAQRKADEAAALEAKRKADEAARVAAAQAEAARIAALPVAAPVFVPEAPKGVKMRVNYRVTDLDELYRWNAGLVTLTERRADILAAIERGKIGEKYPSIPGLEIFEEPYVR